MKTIQKNGKLLLVVDENLLIQTEGDFLDLMASTPDSDCVGLIVHEKNLPADFFDLSTRFAGNVLQKLANYRFKIGIVGDFSVYPSKNFRDFVYECNNGNCISFQKTEEEAAESLLQ